MICRTLLLAGAAMLLGGEALAETAPEGELVVTGTRTSGRSRLDTISPVDVIGGPALTRQGAGVELAAALASLTPAIDFPRPAITDGTDHVRPATLRGLAPDQTLVLINGIRGHVGALVNVNGSIGRGSTAFDLNTVPTISLDRVEVLRDGASAQYGADAIAGVINLRLRQARSGGGATVNTGVYLTDFATSRGEHSRGDGFTWSASGWQGLPLGKDGYLTVSAEYVKRNPTNRSDFVNLTAAPAYGSPVVLGRFGDPDLESWAGWLNASLPINEMWSLYSFGGYQHRNTEAAATARPYNNANNVPAVYPQGFLPIIATDIDDVTAAGGLKGDLNGLSVDANVSYGKNKLHYHVLNSINASYGATSPTTFDAGRLAYDQWIVGLDLAKPFEIGLVKPLNVAVGAEWRRESFQVAAGDTFSYTVGPVAGKAGVSQGFPGFRPSNATDISRHNWSAYLDLEGNLTEAFSFGLAGRYEDYSDFGSKATGKISARYDFSPSFALRGAVSNGFKSPALQQQFFSYTSTNAVTTVINGQTVTSLIEAGTFRVTDPAAIALGAKPLKPETSTNYSVGLVLRKGGFELTVDGYWIDVKDRIVYSENLGVASPTTTPATLLLIQQLLQPYGVSAARFFLNGVDTTTKGVDVVARYRIETASLGRFDLTAAANFNNTDVTRTPDLPVITNIPQPAFLFDRGNVLTFEEGTPERKLVFTADWLLDRLGATLKVTSYDSVLVPNNNASLDYQTGAATLVDLEARYRLSEHLNLAVGANNLFDEYPNFTPGAINSPSGSVGFPNYSPYGFNGRFVYARASVTW
jgi:iron complex outermembrane receptor protein